MRRQTNNRAGFTLVELMVAMALTLFVMIILSQAFVTSLETFSGIKGIGDMQENLRVATTLLRDDLRQDHFPGKRRLSDVDLATRTDLIALQPPQAGFFAIKQGSVVSTTAGAPYFFEGTDANGMPSYRATDHVLYMASKRKGNRQESFYSAVLNGNANILNPFFTSATAYDIPVANMPDNTLTIPYAGGNTGFYNSQWAEVIYYLKRQGTTDEADMPTSILGTPTFQLYRAQYVMVPDATNLKANAFFTKPTPGTPTTAGTLLNWAFTSYGQMSCQVATIGTPAAPQFQLQFLTPADAAQGNRIIPNLTAFNPQAAALNAVTARALVNETLVVPNVLSFQVQIMQNNSAGFNPQINGGIYDTTQMSSAGYGNRFGVKAIQVTLRVWDHKTRQTRQISVVQDL